MADQQIALARTTGTVAGRGSSSHLNKSARQVVPQFLQKIYEMVNDPSNSALIRWSDAGDSFYVLDHERFAREVLGRWFKHQNFSSFVRQLNMYGFHKIPHLQQGVLKSASGEPEAEFWNFEHPNFHRGQPDLLCLIQRKKQAGSANDEEMGGGGVGGGAGGAGSRRSGSPPTGPLSAGQLLDINSIVSGIAAIKRHQTAISTDLNDLRTSNELLWQEAMASRERHKKHQDTINRILKFLAGVFGQGSGGVGAHKDDGGMGGMGMGSHAGGRGRDEDERGAVVPRMAQRLLIGNGSGEGRLKEKGISIEELKEDDEPDYFGQDASHRFTNVETHIPTHQTFITPAEINSPAPSDTSRFASVPPNPQPAASSSQAQTPQDFRMQEPIYEHSYADQKPQQQQEAQQQQQAQQQQPRSQQPQVQPPPQQQLMTTNNNGGSKSGEQSPDAVLQAAFAQMLQSPTQMQRLLSALAAQSINPMPEPAPPPQEESEQQQQQQQYNAGQGYQQQQQQQLWQQQPQQLQTYDYSRGFIPENMYASQPSSAASATDPYQDGNFTVQNQAAESPGAEGRLQKTYKDTAEIEHDVNVLNSSINSLIQSLGLDPTHLQLSDQGQGQGQPQVVNPHDTVLPNGMGVTGGTGEGADYEVDFANFLSDIQNGDGTTNYAQFQDKLETSGVDGAIHEPSPAEMNAFLDEVASVSDGTASPVNVSYPHREHDASEVYTQQQQAKRGAKRKSDVADLPMGGYIDDGKRSNRQLGTQQVSPPGIKSKRKK